MSQRSENTILLCDCVRGGGSSGRGGGGEKNLSEQKTAE
jgi:hypothetical protein